MDLNIFKRLVDAHHVATEGAYTRPNEHQLLLEIKECFPANESSQAQSYIRQILDDLALRYLCDSDAVQPYLGVAQALKLALREVGVAQSPEIDWTRAVQVGLKHAQLFESGLPLEQRWLSDVRICSISKAIRTLRNLSFIIELPPNGGVNISDGETKRLANEIDRLSRLLGRTLVSSAVMSMKSLYSSLTGRFKIGRDGRTMQLDAEPQQPLAYLYQLGLRYFDQAQSPSAGSEEFNRLVDLLTCGVALLDVTTDSMDLMFARPTDMVWIMQKSLVYDAVFLLPQAKPAHVQQFLGWLLNHPPLSQLKDKQGRTTGHILSAARMMLRKCEHGDASAFIDIRPHEAAFATGLDIEPATDLLRDAFTHVKGANRRLSFPPKDTDVDSAFRPLFAVNGGFLMQPPSLAARTILNASLDWCRQQWPKGSTDTFDETLGKVFEVFVREQFIEHGVPVLHGDYTHGKTGGECDLVIESEKAVIFFELKSKVLTRKSRAGDDVSALADLADSLVRPQAQAMERHAFLLKHGTMQLTASNAKNSIELRGREVLKVSITRGELGSLHDRPFLQQFLRSGCVLGFQTSDPGRQHELNHLHEWFGRFKDAAHRAGEGDFGKQFPFAQSWSLSVFQLLLLLERTKDSESFTKELLRTRQMLTPVRDFYTEYEFKLSLGQYSSGSISAPNPA